MTGPLRKTSTQNKNKTEFMTAKNILWLFKRTVDKVVAGLMIRVTEPSRKPKNKVTVVGTGMVGMACAVSLLSQVINTIPDS